MTTKLPRATPRSKGVNASGILAFLEAVKGLELHSFLLYRAGAVVAEGYWHPYAADIPHAQHSATKSWNATAIGLLIGDGRLNLTDKVVSFFPDDLPAIVSDNLAAMTVQDLLTMRSGHRTGISGGEWRGSKESWVRAFLREPVPDRPGESFIYSSGSSYMLSAIATKVTGQRVAELMAEKVFRPLEMGAIGWDVSPEGFNTGGNGLTCVTEDVAKFGALYLADGIWNGTRILPEGWVKEASSPFVTDAWLGTLDGKRFLPRESASRAMGGYGYQWWLTPGVGYRASGVYGQLCIILPQHDAVIVTTAAVPPREPSLLPIILQHLLPALAGAGDGDDELAATLLALKLPTIEGAPASPTAAAVTGQNFAMAPNEDQVTQVSFVFGAGDALFTLHDHRGTHHIRVGLANGVMGDTTMTGNILHHEYQPDSLRVLGRGVWQDDNTFAMEWRFIETAFCDFVTCRFAGDTLTLERRVNTNAGPLSRPILTGRIP
jgi:CubicO group peptidase (beta-lactamase class C family)